ncbi:hypothetical protein JCM8097_006782 [Rhodosporidiobolus ruineniae]
MSQSSGAHAYVFYGLNVRTQSLLLAAIAHHHSSGGRAVIASLRAPGLRLPSDKAVLRVPLELWDRIEEELLSLTYGERKLQVESGRDLTRYEVPYEEFIRPKGYAQYRQDDKDEELFDDRCRRCGAEGQECGEEWASVLFSAPVNRLVSEFLAFYGLILASRRQYTFNDVDGIDEYSSCSISFPFHLRNAKGRRLKTKGMMCEDAVPPGADELFEQLLTECPALEVAAAQVELCFEDGGEQDAEAGGCKAKKAQPGWRVFLSAIELYEEY